MKLSWRESHAFPGCKIGIILHPPRLWRHSIPSLESSFGLDPEPTARFETEPGEQTQVDWGSAKAWLGEQALKVHLFVMALGHGHRGLSHGPICGVLPARNGLPALARQVDPSRSASIAKTIRLRS